MSNIQEAVHLLSRSDKIDMVLYFISQWPEKDIDDLLGEEIYLEENPKQIIIGSSTVVVAVEDSSLSDEQE
tara:strand:+ start:1668 stop:1880 length:213 start_codon:yes stop_codon:yes gene_type:complete